MAKDLYEILGVTKDASADDIKRAYRKLAKKLHPDVTGGDSKSSDRFKEISAAFETLGDTDRRKLYDEFGDESLRPGFDAAKARAYKEWAHNGGGGFGWQNTGFDQNPFSGAADASGMGGMDDLLGSLFGGRSGHMQRSRNIARTLEIDLETAMRGGTMRLTLENEVSCTQCDGRGVVGHASRSPCMACQGRGRTLVRDSLSVNIPARAPDGSKLKIRGRGAQGSRGAKGDLIIEIKIAPHAVFRREGKDLLVELPLTVDEAVLGAKVPLVTPDGRNITVSVPAGSQSGQSLRLKGQGLGRGKRSGSIIASLSIRVPKEGGQEAAKALREAYDDEVDLPPRR